MGEPRVSIALATFNGAKFLEVQLESLIRQTFPPIEIVVADDGSTDGTLEILGRYAAKIPLRIIATDGGHGPTRNFERAMKACRGEFVFFCDQDDFWHPYKIERMLREFDDETTVVFCDADLVNANLKPMGTTLWRRLHFNPPDFDPLEHFGSHTIAFGLTMAYRNSDQMRSLVFPIPMPFGHDNFTALIGASIGRVGLVPMALLDYRQHSAQVSGSLGKKSAVQRSISPTAVSFENLVDRLEGVSLGPSGSLLVRAMASKAKHLRERESLQEIPRFSRMKVIAEMALTGDYHRHSNGFRSVIKDAVSNVLAR
jgi:hypothetical protein